MQQPMPGIETECGLLTTNEDFSSIKSDSFHMQVRLPSSTTDEVDEDPTGTKAFWDRGLLNGAPQKVRCKVQVAVKAAYLLRFRKKTGKFSIH